jgi:hemophore-related protein
LVAVRNHPLKEPAMLASTGTARPAVAAVIGAGAIAGAILFTSNAIAVADPPPPPPNCTAADLAGIASGVSAATSSYLLTHPDVNDFFTGLKGQPRDQVKDDVQNYLNANPQTQADLQGIRQPMVDFRNRCGA